MSNVAVIGDAELAVGFRLAGVGSVHEAKPQNASQVFEDVLSKGFDIIIITEKLAAVLKKQLVGFEEELKPVIVEIPDKTGSTGYAQEMIRELIKRAVGVDLTAKES